jgi:hypothetical protein
VELFSAKAKDILKLYLKEVTDVKVKVNVIVDTVSTQLATIQMLFSHRLLHIILLILSFRPFKQKPSLAIEKNKHKESNLNEDNLRKHSLLFVEVTGQKQLLYDRLYYEGISSILSFSVVIFTLC